MLHTTGINAYCALFKGKVQTFGKDLLHYNCFQQSATDIQHGFWQSADLQQEPLVQAYIFHDVIPVVAPIGSNHGWQNGMKCHVPLGMSRH
jgi:hypothetical protein